jgi:hypothetical protein
MGGPPSLGSATRHRIGELPLDASTFTAVSGDDAAAGAKTTGFIRSAEDSNGAPVKTTCRAAPA